MAKQNWTVVLVLIFSSAADAQTTKKPATSKDETPWFLQSVVRPAIPANLTPSTNPIDAFIAAQIGRAHV